MSEEVRILNDESPALCPCLIVMVGLRGQHPTRRLAELILDQLQRRAVFRREPKNEALGHRLQVAARLFGDVRGMVVQHEPNSMVLRIGAVQLF